MTTERDPIYGCELWTGRLDKDGYGMHPSGRRAHLVAYEREHGKVPSGMELEHACRRRRCVCIAHLVPVTRSENERRKSWRYRAKQTKCPRGHDMSTNAMVTPEGGRICRRCSKGNI